MMGSEWAFRSLGECAELVKDSFRPDEEMDVPYIGLEHIAENSLRLLGWGSSKDVVSVKSRFRTGDILFGKLRPYFRKVIRAPFDGVCSTDIWVIRPKPGIDAGFLFYWVASQEFVDKAMAGAEGTKMPRAKWDFVTRIQKQIPPLPEQRAIAHILGTLDDQIETLRRMNETLEGIARALFKAWFVDFEPVRAKMSGRWRRGQSLPGLPADLYDLFPDTLIPSELGQIPQGWVVSTIGKEVKVVGGGTPSTQEPRFWENGIHFFATPKDLSNLSAPVLLETERKVTDEGLAKISSGLLPVNTVLLSSRAPVGYLAIAHVPVCINQGFIAMICDGVLSPYYAFLWAYHNMSLIKGRASGTTFSEINKKNFRPLPVIMPDDGVLQAFDKLVTPAFEKIAANLEQSRTLAALRDALLPELISGRLRLADAERFLQARGL
jgi:type I restriction enzyme S subunit